MKLEGALKELSATASYIQDENARFKLEAGNNKVMKVVGRFMVRKMRERLTEAKASEQVVRDNEAALNHRFVRSEQKCAAIENELQMLRRRQSERDAAYDETTHWRRPSNAMLAAYGANALKSLARSHPAVFAEHHADLRQLDDGQVVRR